MMNRYFRWLLDPCFHIIVIGAVLFQIAASMGADNDQASDPQPCTRCKLTHAHTLVCPVAVANVTTVSR